MARFMFITLLCCTILIAGPVAAAGAALPATLGPVRIVRRAVFVQGFPVDEGTPRWLRSDTSEFKDSPWTTRSAISLTTSASSSSTVSRSR